MTQYQITVGRNVVVHRADGTTTVNGELVEDRDRPATATPSRPAPPVRPTP